MMLKSFKFSAALVLIAVCAAACGISGPLEKAPPMWGPDRAAYEAERAKQEAEAKQKAAERAAREAAKNAPAPVPAPKN